VIALSPAPPRSIRPATTRSRSNDAGDAVLLVAKTNGANIRWSVVSNDGAALSTV